MSKKVMENNKPSVKFAWQRLENWCKQYLPELLYSLNPGTTIYELDDFEAAIGQRLPIDVRESYLIHNGQQENHLYMTGLLFGVPILPLFEALREWQYWRQIETDSDNDEMNGEYTFSAPHGAIQPNYTNPGWIPLTFDGCGNHIGIDLAPDRNGVVGQVIAFGYDENVKYVIANSWADFLNNVAFELEAGNFCINQEGQDKILNIKDPPSQRYHDALATIYRTIKEYRCTRSALYQHDCPGQNDLGERRGYYIWAQTEEEAWQIMATRYPEETTVGFTVEKWEG